MSPEMGRAGFTLAVFVFGTSLALLPFVPRDSAEFVVTVLAAIVGGLTILVIAILARLARR